MRSQLFKLLEEAIEKMVDENRELYENWAIKDDSISHLRIKDKAVHEVMKVTGGSINPSVIKSLVALEFPHCH